MSEENLLSRWSRRKQQSIEQTRDEDLLIELENKGLAESEINKSLTDDESQQAVEEAAVLTDEDMPPIESLNEDSDFSVFMSSGVSDSLRNLALRKLFKVPVFNLRDGLDEYDEDYTSFEALGNIVTSDMKHQLEVEAKKKLEQGAESMLEDDSEVEFAESEEMDSTDSEDDDQQITSEPSGETENMNPVDPANELEQTMEPTQTMTEKLSK